MPHAAPNYVHPDGWGQVIQHGTDVAGCIWPYLDDIMLDLSINLSHLPTFASTAIPVSTQPTSVHRMHQPVERPFVSALGDAALTLDNCTAPRYAQLRRELQAAGQDTLVDAAWSTRPVTDWSCGSVWLLFQPRGYPEYLQAAGIPGLSLLPGQDVASVWPFWNTSKHVGSVFNQAPAGAAGIASACCADCGAVPPRISSSLTSARSVHAGKWGSSSLSSVAVAVRVTVAAVAAGQPGAGQVVTGGVDAGVASGVAVWAWDAMKGWVPSSAPVIRAPRVWQDAASSTGTLARLRVALDSRHVLHNLVALRRQVRWTLASGESPAHVLPPVWQAPVIPPVHTVTAMKLFAGVAANCALLSTGDLRCWGGNWEGTLGMGYTTSVGDDEVPLSAGSVPLGEPVVDASIGESIACAVLANNLTVKCWGGVDGAVLGRGNASDLALIGDDEPAYVVSRVSLSGRALRVGVIATGACAIMAQANGTTICWGATVTGREVGYKVVNFQSNAGTRFIGKSSPLTRPVDNLTHAAALYKYRYGMCATRTVGALHCWGGGGVKFGERDSQHTYSPGIFRTDELGHRRVVEYNMDTFGACMLFSTGGMRCVGSSTPGCGHWYYNWSITIQNAASCTRKQSIPIVDYMPGMHFARSGPNLTTPICGDWSALGMRWYVMSEGPDPGPGADCPGFYLSPRMLGDVAMFEPAVQPGSPGLLSCALTVSGNMVCRGEDPTRVPGYPGYNASSLHPPAWDETTGTWRHHVQLSARVAQVEQGLQHVCALTVHGEVRCLAAQGAYGRLGTGNLRGVGVSSAATDTPPVALIAPGETAACKRGGALQPVQVLRTLAGNVNQPALPQLTASCRSALAYLPPPPLAAPAVLDIAAAPEGYHFCALVADATALRQMAEAKTAGQPVYTVSSLPQGALDDFANWESALAGDLRCWGAGFTGQSGHGGENIGTTVSPLSLPAVPVGGRVKHVALGSAHTCVVLERQDLVAAMRPGATSEPVASNLRCWGSGSFGMLGQGSEATLGLDGDVSSVPLVPVGGIALKTGLGRAHTCAIVIDSATQTQLLRCWGENSQSQALSMDAFLCASYGQYPVDTETWLPQDRKPVDLVAGPLTTCVTTTPVSQPFNLAIATTVCMAPVASATCGYLPGSEHPETVTVQGQQSQVLVGSPYVSGIGDPKREGIETLKLIYSSDWHDVQLGLIQPGEADAGLPLANSKVSVLSVAGISACGISTCTETDRNLCRRFLKCWGVADVPAGPTQQAYAARATELQSAATAYLTGCVFFPAACSQEQKRRQFSALVSVDLFNGTANMWAAAQPKVHTSGNPADEDFIDVSNALKHTCVLLRNLSHVAPDTVTSMVWPQAGTVRCWGDGPDGRLGTALNVDVATLADAPALQLGENVVRVVAARTSSCALLSTGDVKCWGSSSNGETGMGRSIAVGKDAPAGQESRSVLIAALDVVRSSPGVHAAIGRDTFTPNKTIAQLPDCRPLNANITGLWMPPAHCYTPSEVEISSLLPHTLVLHTHGVEGAAYASRWQYGYSWASLRIDPSAVLALPSLLAQQAWPAYMPPFNVIGGAGGPVVQHDCALGREYVPASAVGHSGAMGCLVNAAAATFVGGVTRVDFASLSANATSAPASALQISTLGGQLLRLLGNWSEAWWLTRAGADMQAFVGDRECTNFRISSAREAVCVTPAGVGGNLRVEVRHTLPYTGAVVVPHAVVYTKPTAKVLVPHDSSDARLNPLRANTVDILGSGYGYGTILAEQGGLPLYNVSVLIGGTECQDVEVVADAKLTCVLPAVRGADLVADQLPLQVVVAGQQLNTTETKTQFRPLRIPFVSVSVLRRPNSTWCATQPVGSLPCYVDITLGNLDAGEPVLYSEVADVLSVGIAGWQCPADQLVMSAANLTCRSVPVWQLAGQGCTVVSRNSTARAALAVLAPDSMSISLAASTRILDKFCAGSRCNVTLFGSGLTVAHNEAGLLPQVFIGEVPCVVQALRDTELLCITTTRGLPLVQPVRFVTPGGQQVSSAVAVQFSDHAVLGLGVDHIVRTEAVAFANITLTMAGLPDPALQWSMQVYIAGARCGSAWVVHSASEIVCADLPLHRVLPSTVALEQAYDSTAPCATAAKSVTALVCVGKRGTWAHGSAAMNSSVQVLGPPQLLRVSPLTVDADHPTVVRIKISQHSQLAGLLRRGQLTARAGPYACEALADVGSELACTLPPAVGTKHDVVLQLAGGITSNHVIDRDSGEATAELSSFQVQAAQPVVEALAPSTFTPVGLVHFAITGTGLGHDLAAINASVAGVPCVVQAREGSSVLCTADFDAAPAQQRALEVEVGQSAFIQAKVRVRVLAAPVITSISPEIPQPGQTVRIVGTNLAVRGNLSTVQVTVGSAACADLATALVDEDGVATVLECQAPAFGLREVSVSNGVGAASFEFAMTVIPTGNISVLTAKRGGGPEEYARAELWWLWCSDGSAPGAWTASLASSPTATRTDSTVETVSAQDCGAVPRGTACAEQRGAATRCTWYTGKVNTLVLATPYSIRMKALGTAGMADSATALFPAQAWPVLEQCVLGEYLDASAGMHGAQCRACVAGATCAGGVEASSVTNQVGFSNVAWAAESVAYGACPVADACPSNQSTCAPGYIGLLCGNCANGYALGADGTCSQCASKGVVALTAVAGALACVVVMAFLVRDALGEDSVATADRNFVVFKRIVINHFHQVGLMSAFNYQFPSAITGLITLAEFSTAAGDALLAPDCLWGERAANASPGDPAADEQYSYEYTVTRAKTLATVLLPFALIAVTAVLVLLRMAWKQRALVQRAAVQASAAVARARRRRMSLNPRVVAASAGVPPKRLLTVCVSTMLFFFYVGTTRTALQLFRCSVVGPEEQQRSRFTDDLDVACDAPGNLVWQRAVGIPVLILYTAGFPVGLVYTLHKHRRTLWRDVELQRRWGVLFGAYKHHVPYYEAVIATRKGLMAAVLVFLGQYSFTMQAAAALLVLLASAVVQLYVRPYARAGQNMAEEVSLYVACVTVLGGLLLDSSETPGGLSAVVSVVVVGMNVLLVSWLVVAAVLDFVATSKLRLAHRAAQLQAKVDRWFVKRSVPLISKVGPAAQGSASRSSWVQMGTLAQTPGSLGQATDTMAGSPLRGRQARVACGAARSTGVSESDGLGSPELAVGESTQVSLTPPPPMSPPAEPAASHALHHSLRFSRVNPLADSEAGGSSSAGQGPASGPGRRASRRPRASRQV